MIWNWKNFESRGSSLPKTLSDSHNVETLWGSERVFGWVDPCTRRNFENFPTKKYSTVVSTSSRDKRIISSGGIKCHLDDLRGFECSWCSRNFFCRVRVIFSRLDISTVTIKGHVDGKQYFRLSKTIFVHILILHYTISNQANNLLFETLTTSMR